MHDVNIALYWSRVLTCALVKFHMFNSGLDLWLLLPSVVPTFGERWVFLLILGFRDRKAKFMTVLICLDLVSH